MLATEIQSLDPVRHSKTVREKLIDPLAKIGELKVDIPGIEIGGRLIVAAKYQPGICADIAKKATMAAVREGSDVLSIGHFSKIHFHRYPNRTNPFTSENFLPIPEAEGEKQANTEARKRHRGAK